MDNEIYKYSRFLLIKKKRLKTTTFVIITAEISYPLRKLTMVLLQIKQQQQKKTWLL